VWRDNQDIPGEIVRYFSTVEEALAAGYMLGHYFTVFRVECDKIA